MNTVNVSNIKDSRVKYFFDTFNIAVSKGILNLNSNYIPVFDEKEFCDIKMIAAAAGWLLNRVYDDQYDHNVWKYYFTEIKVPEKNKIEVTLLRWEDTSEKLVNDDMYSGWGYKLYVGQIYIGWLVAFSSGKFEIAVPGFNERLLSLDECIKKINDKLNDKIKE